MNRDIPIIAKAHEVRTLLDGRKTMWRVPAWEYRDSDAVGPSPVSHDGLRSTPWQRIQPGSRLWVRETWAHYQTINHIRRTHGGAFSEVSDGLVGYRADGHNTIEDFREHVRLMSECDLEAIEINNNRWRSPVLMPRWASRLTLIVTAVKIERLQEISEADAIAEGSRTPLVDLPKAARKAAWSEREAFANIWNSLHGPDAWAENPEVVAITFTVHKQNIDALASSEAV